MLFVIGVDDDSRTAIKAVSEGLPHSGKCDFLNIVKTNIPLRFNENIFIYFYYFNCWFTGWDSEKQDRTKHNCAI